MKNILFVSIAFPPKSDAEGLQVAKYLKYILRDSSGKLNIDAITSQQKTLNMSYDASLEAISDGVRDLIEIPIFENRYTNFLLRKLLPSIIHSPDSKYSFHLQANRAIRQLRQRPDLIYSRSFPPSSAVMAYKLKKHYQVPWVMHLSDIWADCPERPYTRRVMAYQQGMEEACFNAADVVCVTSKKTLAFYENKYAGSNARIEYYPNVFDMEDRLPVVSDHVSHVAGKLKIVHTGSLIGDRSPEPFLRVIQSLPLDRQAELDVQFVGAVDSRNRAVFERYRMGCVTCTGPVDYQKALEIQRSADVSLLIDMPVASPEMRVFFPSKILDYMLTGHPILALIDPGSEVQRVVETHGLGTCIVRNDSRGLADHLLWLLDNRRGSYFASRDLVMEFDAALNAKRLVDLFDEYL